MMASRKSSRHRPVFRRRGAFIAIGLATSVLLGARLALPSAIERAANARLSALPNHQAHIEDVDLNLFRGAYQLKGLTVVSRGADSTEPLLSIRHIDLSIAWRELIQGHLVADIVLEEPVLTLQPGQLRTEEGLEEASNEIVSLEITRLEIRRGILRYRDAERTHPIDLALHNVSATVEGLTLGSVSAGHRLPVQADLHAFAPGNGHLHIVAKGEPAIRPPRFEIAAELSDSDLTAYSGLVRSSLGVDVFAGKLHVSFEANARDGRYEGYVKPLIQGARFEEPDEGPLKALWAKVVNTVTEALKNDETRRLGTRVPFSGNFEETDVEAWPSFVALLQNAFGQALREGVDGDTAPSAP